MGGGGREKKHTLSCGRRIAPCLCPTRAFFFETVNNYVLLLCGEAKIPHVTDGCLSNSILQFASLRVVQRNGWRSAASLFMPLYHAYYYVSWHVEAQPLLRAQNVVPPGEVGAIIPNAIIHHRSSRIHLYAFTQPLPLGFQPFHRHPLRVLERPRYCTECYEDVSLLLQSPRDVHERTALSFPSAERLLHYFIMFHFQITI